MSTKVTRGWHSRPWSADSGSRERALHWELRATWGHVGESRDAQQFTKIFTCQGQLPSSRGKTRPTDVAKVPMIWSEEGELRDLG